MGQAVVFGHAPGEKEESVTGVVVNRPVEPDELPRPARWWFENAADKLHERARLAARACGEKLFPRAASAKPIERVGEEVSQLLYVVAYL
ncbi:MAG: hypothetical protein HOY69_36255 [Streptomyces sp.]|nr:hypothetical protein [Streptomyces sp.]